VTPDAFPCPCRGIGMAGQINAGGEEGKGKGLIK
jgi:hypothetical protein